MAALNDALEPLLKHTSEFKIRPFHEQGTVLLGTALSLVNNLPEADLRRDSFAMSFTTIFRGVLYRDRATKKLARAFFRNALRSTLTYLVHSRSENQTVLAVEYCLQQAIFSPDNLVDYINAIEAAERMKQDDIGFVALMTSLAASDTPSGSFDGNFCGKAISLIVRCPLSSYSTQTWPPSIVSTALEFIPIPEVLFSLHISIFSRVFLLTIVLRNYPIFRDDNYVELPPSSQNMRSFRSLPRCSATIIRCADSDLHDNRNHVSLVPRLYGGLSVEVGLGCVNPDNEN